MTKSALSRHDLLNMWASSIYNNGISAWKLRSKKVEQYDDLKYVSSGPLVHILAYEIRLATPKICHYRSFFRCMLRGWDVQRAQTCVKHLWVPVTLLSRRGVVELWEMMRHCRSVRVKSRNIHMPTNLCSSQLEYVHFHHRLCRCDHNNNIES